MIGYVELYNIIACIIQKLVHSQIDPILFTAYDCNNDHDKGASDGFLKALDNHALSDLGYRLLSNQSTRENLYCLILCMNEIEERAQSAFMDYLYRKFDVEYYNVYSFGSLNSSDNIDKTGIILFPHVHSIWEGRSGNRFHDRSWNLYLSNTIYIEKSTISDFAIECHYLNPSYFNIKKTDKRGRLYLRMAASPISNDYSCNYHSEVINGVRYFMVDNMDCCYSDRPEIRVLDIIRKADEVMDCNARGVDILVFPEMLGTDNLTQFICDELSNVPLDNIGLIVLPGIWKYDKENGPGMNYCDVITGGGEILFKQHKLVQYVSINGACNSLEYIDTNKVLHILYARNVGALCVLICVSDLITKIRSYIQDSLGINLILAPSYAKGGFEFIRSAMAGAELDCNVVWCNTCSGLKKPGPVCYITNYSKDVEHNGITSGQSSFLSNENCAKTCTNGDPCLHIVDVYESYQEGSEQLNGGD